MLRLRGVVKPSDEMMRLFDVAPDLYGFGPPPDLRSVAAKIIWFGRGEPQRPFATGHFGDRASNDEREIEDLTADAVRWIYEFGSSLAERAVWSGRPVYVRGVTVRSLAEHWDQPWVVPYRVAPEILRMLEPGCRVPAGPIGNYSRVCRALIRERQLFEPFIENVLKVWIQRGVADAAEAAA